MDASEARTAHIRLLVADAGGPTAFANRYGDGRWSAVQVNQWISATNPKGIGRRLARDLEEAVGLPNGAMDRPPASQAARIDPEKMAASAEFVQQMQDDLGVDLPDDRYWVVVAAAYDYLTQTPKPNTVELTLRIGRMVEGKDERQREVGGAGKGAKGGVRPGTKAAKAKARRAG
jgi:hypothetical protein